MQSEAFAKSQEIPPTFCYFPWAILLLILFLILVVVGVLMWGPTGFELAILELLGLCLIH